MMLQQKAAIRQHHHNHTVTRRELREWATRKFSLRHPLAKSTLANALNARNADPSLPLTRRARHTARFLLLESPLAIWVVRCEELKLAIITGATIKHKAEKIRRELLPTMDSDAAAWLTALRFSPRI